MSKNAQKHPHRWAVMLINMFSCICMLTQISIHFFIDPSQNHKKLKKIKIEFFVKKSSSSYSVGLRRYATSSSGLSFWYHVKIYHGNMHSNFKQFSNSRRWPYSSFNISFIFYNVFSTSNKTQILLNESSDISNFISDDRFSKISKPKTWLLCEYSDFFKVKTLFWLKCSLYFGLLLYRFFYD